MVSVRRSELAATRAHAAVAVRSDTAPILLDVPVDRASIEEEMVECVCLTWRLPGDGPVSAFAADGPWHLMVRDAYAGDYDARGGDLDDAPAPRVPLTQRDHVRMERAAGWLGRLEARPGRRGQTSAASDGAIVAAVLRQKAAGLSQIDWARVLRAVGLTRGKEGARKRYDRALAWLATSIARDRL